MVLPRGPADEEREKNVDEVRVYESRELAVPATVGENGRLEAALMRFAVLPALEICFRCPEELAQVSEPEKEYGGTTEVTVPYEGIAEELEGKELVQYQRPYFVQFADGPHGIVGRASHILWYVRSGEVLRLQSADAPD